MCGIVGYIGKKKATPILLEGIKQLEYRGYDSSGIALLEKNRLKKVKAVGRIVALEEKLTNYDFNSSLGIVHTRWATHGNATLANAHPHTDSKNQIAVVHNGIIENYLYIREQLIREGHHFKSETDTEVISHLIEKYLDESLSFEEAVRRALKEIEGTYGLAIICSKYPDRIIAARNGSPLIIGIGKEEHIIASDVSAIIKHTEQIIYLEDNEMAVVTKDNFSTTTIDNISTVKKIERISWNIDKIEKGGFKHFMLKEIFEQPESIMNTMRGRISEEEWEAHLGGIKSIEKFLLNDLNRIIICACGTSWHAALVAEYLLEEYTRIPVEVEYSSEFRYRNPIIDKNTLVIVISQSGETADTLAALKEAKRKKATVLGINNVVGSTIARESDCGIYIHAGPEIGVASTKAFTSQLVALILLTIELGRNREMSITKSEEFITDLKDIPKKAEKILKKSEEIKKIAHRFYQSDSFIFLGRGYNFPVALEGALKLKEISYIHAEGYPAAEMKHGPIALITPKFPTMIIATQGSTYKKTLSNLEEIKARKGKVIAIATEGDKLVSKKADYVIYIPKVVEPLIPLLSVIPLQLFAYYIAVKRKCDVDKPRNLAKSVTVE
ncbi:glutamine--fructose-6-phosphate transaminase (isomerizing) [Candidatus Auribacterota bacterium]